MMLPPPEAFLAVPPALVGESPRPPRRPSRWAQLVAISIAALAVVILAEIVLWAFRHERQPPAPQVAINRGPAFFTVGKVTGLDGTEVPESQAARLKHELLAWLEGTGLHAAESRCFIHLEVEVFIGKARHRVLPKIGWEGPAWPVRLAWTVYAGRDRAAGKKLGTIVQKNDVPEVSDPWVAFAKGAVPAAVPGIMKLVDCPPLEMRGHGRVEFARLNKERNA